MLCLQYLEKGKLETIDKHRKISVPTNKETKHLLTNIEKFDT